jgi:hypothetical protein
VIPMQSLSSPSSFIFLPLLILSRRALARLELIQVPPADSKTTLVLIHALSEVVDVGRAGTRRLLHLRRGGVLVLAGEFRRLGRRFGGSRGAAAEPAADGVADGGSYCDTAGGGVSGVVAWLESGLTRRWMPSGRTDRVPAA